MKKIVSFVLVALLAVCFAAELSCAQVGQIMTKSEIMAKAQKYVQDSGKTLEEVDVVYDDGNTMWSERAVVLEQDAENKGVLPHGMLVNKEYQVVYFDYVEVSPQGDIWIFVDSSTGDIIAMYEEKK